MSHKINLYNKNLKKNFFLVDESPKIGQMILSEEDKKVLNNDKVTNSSFVF